MTLKEEQRIIIAQACGWKWGEIAQGYRFIGDLHLDDDSKNSRELLPDYPNDLNAMHEAEKVLTYPQQVDYLQLLRRTTKGREMFATASQRAEAFCHTIL